MLSHVQRHPISSALASVSGLGAGAIHWLHIASGFMADVSGVLGAIISTVTVAGMVRTWLRNRRRQQTPALD